MIQQFLGWWRHRHITVEEAELCAQGRLDEIQRKQFAGCKFCQRRIRKVAEIRWFCGVW